MIVGLLHWAQAVFLPLALAVLFAFAFSPVAGWSALLSTGAMVALVASLLSWVVTELVVGLIARALVPGKQHIGLFLTVLLGVAGACLGGLLSMALWSTWANDPDVSRMWTGWLMAVAGGVVVLWGYLAATGRRDMSYLGR